MKKKFLTILLAAGSCLIGACAFSACLKDPENTTTHSHSLTAVAAKSPTCTAEGNTAYYTCDCGKWFADPEAESEITDKGSVVVAATGHTITRHEKKDSACTAIGWAEYVTCDNCGYTTYKEISATGVHTYVGGKCTGCGLAQPLSGVELRAEAFERDDTALFKKVSNDTETFSFLNGIEVADGANYRIYSDLQCKNEIASKADNLLIGDNVFYVLVTLGNESEIYTATVRRRPKYTVTFNTSGGTAVEAQQVEEDSIISAPHTKKPGYTVSWDHDFTKPILNNTTITASWTSDPAISNYYYTSTDSDFTITGVKDKSITEAVIPDYVTAIGDSAFKDWSALTSITIRDGVTSIGDEAFSFCVGLTSITLPDSVTSIGNSAFKVCSWLVNVKLSNRLSSIGDSVFFGCSKLTEVTIPDSVEAICDNAFYDCNKLTDITIGKNVTSIGSRAFWNCEKLTSITIPKSVTDIGDFLFYTCNALTEINYDGTKAQWTDIVKGDLWNYLMGDYVIRCTDGDIAKS